MSKDYDMIHYIQERCPNSIISDVSTRLFARLDGQTIYGAALSSSISFVIALAMYHIPAQLILGTIGIPGTGKSFPSAWVEIHDKIFDFSIYFDTLRHPVLQEENIIIKPQINVGYDEADVDYFDFQFVDIFPMSDIARTVDKTFKEFCNESPNGDDIWCDVFYAIQMNQTPENLARMEEIASHFKIKTKRQ